MCKRQNLASPVGQREKLRVAGAPDFLGGVLDLRGIVVGHQLLDGGKSGEEFGAAVQFDLAFGAQILEGENGIARILLDGFLHLFFGGVADDQQGGRE